MKQQTCTKSDGYSDLPVAGSRSRSLSTRRGRGVHVGGGPLYQKVRAKYVFVQYIGPGVKPLTRAKAGPARSHFESVLHGTHLSINITEEKELAADTLQKKLHSNCGAHQPNRYEFGPKITDAGDL